MGSALFMLVLITLLGFAVFRIMKWKEQHDGLVGTAVGRPETATPAIQPPHPLPPISVTPPTGAEMVAELLAMAGHKVYDVWMSTRRDRLIRLVKSGDTLYIEHVDGDEYVDRPRGGVLPATVYLVEAGRHAVLVWASKLAVEDSIKRDVLPAYKSPPSTGLNGVVASDDTARRLKADLSVAEPLPEVD
jgi:hypothetical protein